MKKIILFTFIVMGMLISCSSDNDVKETIADKSFDYKIVDAKGYDLNSNQVALPFTIDKNSRLTYDKDKKIIELTVFKENTLITSIFTVTSFENNTYHTKVDLNNDFTYDFVLDKGKVVNYHYFQKANVAKIIYVIE